MNDEELHHLYASLLGGIGIFLQEYADTVASYCVGAHKAGAQAPAPAAPGKVDESWLPTKIGDEAVVLFHVQDSPDPVMFLVRVRAVTTTPKGYARYVFVPDDGGEQLVLAVDQDRVWKHEAGPYASAYRIEVLPR